MNPDEMTLEEMRAKLDEMGIPHDKWGEAGQGDKLVQPPMIERYKEFLLRIKKVLEDQVGADKEKVAELHATAQRMKHGGGL